MSCTWEGCQREHEFVRIGDHGKVWAQLCPEHEKQMNAALIGPDVARIVAWVRAHGGLEKMRQAYGEHLKT